LFRRSLGGCGAHASDGNVARVHDRRRRSTLGVTIAVNVDRSRRSRAGRRRLRAGPDERPAQEPRL